MIWQIRWFFDQTGASRLVMAMKGKRNPDYGEISRAARCLWEVLDETLPYGAPVLLVLEQDIAKALGTLMRRFSGGRRQIVVVDNIRTEEGDYMDFGKPVMAGMVIPVIIKTMVFG